MKEDRSLKTIMKNSLRKETIEEKIKEIDERIFMIEMAEKLDSEAMEIIRTLKEIQKELKEKLKCKTNK